MQVFFLSITFFFFFLFFFFWAYWNFIAARNEFLENNFIFFLNLSRKAVLVEILWIFRLINVGNSVVLTIYIIINRSLREVSAECSGSVLQVRVFQLAGNWKAEFRTYESGRRHIQNQLLCCWFEKLFFGNDIFLVVHNLWSEFIAILLKRKFPLFSRYEAAFYNFS